MIAIKIEDKKIDKKRITTTLLAAFKPATTITTDAKYIKKFKEVYFAIIL
jgi:hypothetical protein